MMIFKTRLFASLILAGALGACTVGDDSAPRPGAEGTADAAVGEPDAGAVAQVQWTEVEGTGIAGIKAEMHYVSASEIYAVINDKICMWNGTAWVDHTEVAVGIAASIQFLTPTEIYAVVGNQISKWTGVLGAGGAWEIVTLLPVANLQAAGSADFHRVSDLEIYAVVGEQLQLWNGTVWAEFTLPDIGLQREIHFVTPTEIYAVVGLKIRKWTGVLGVDGAWSDHTLVDQTGLGPAMQFVSPTEIHAMVGDKVCTWDGTAWADVTDSMPGMLPAFHYVSDSDINAIAGISLSHWAEALSDSP